jgi:hypothetical protein
MNYLKQLENITDKQYLHKLIDELADDAQMVILIDKTPTGNEPYHFAYYGSPTVERSLHMVEYLKKYHLT